MSNRLRRLRKEKNMTLRELSKEVNISYSNIAMLEREERNFTVDTVRIFADYFNVSSDYLLGLSDQREALKSTYYERLDDTDIEIVNELKDLSDDDKKDILAVIKYMKFKGEI